MTDTENDRRTDADSERTDHDDDPRRIPPETVQRAVASIEPGWTVREATPADAGHQIVYLLTVETPAGERGCVLKATVPDSIVAAGSEARLQTWIRETTTVPVPEVYGVVDEGAAGDGVGELPTPLLLMERVEGETVRPRDFETVPVERVETIARETGAALAELHTRSPDGFGFLTCDVETSLTGGAPPREPTLSVDGTADWPAFYEQDARETLGGVADTRFADVVADARPAVERDIERIADGGPYRPAVAHIDGNPNNLLFDGDELVGMLDWEFTMATPPTYDLVCMAWGLAGGHRRFLPGVPDQRETVRGALLAGYRSEAPGRVDADRVASRVARHGDAYLLLATLRSMVQFEEVFDRFCVAGDRRDAAARSLRERVRRLVEGRD